MGSSPWNILTTRWGADVREPSAEQLASAVRELFVEDLPQLVDDHYAGHPSAWVRRGFDDGPMFVVTISRDRSARFEQWKDPDYESEAPPSSLALPDEAAAVRLWSLLVAGDLDAVRRLGWQE